MKDGHSVMCKFFHGYLATSSSYVYMYIYHRPFWRPRSTLSAAAYELADESGMIPQQATLPASMMLSFSVISSMCEIAPVVWTDRSVEEESKGGQGRRCSRLVGSGRSGITQMSQLLSSALHGYCLFE